MEGKFAFHPRIIRSPWSDYYGAEIEDSLKAYPEDYLREISSEGYNGVWLHTILHKTVPSKLFAEVKPGRIDALNRLVERVGRFGVKVYLYLCEPRGLEVDHPFWKKHPGIKGQPASFVFGGKESRFFAFCSSTPAVREFLEESAYNLFERVPGLGGVFLITASEHHTSCYSHFPKPREKFDDPYVEDWSKGKFLCKRCFNRDPSDVVAEIITLINKGVKRASPDAHVAAWTWSWYVIEPDPQKKLINLLPKDVILMPDWERGATKKVCGKTFPLDEYSYSYIGPSPRFKSQLRIAKKRGMRVMAKIQIGPTHELASVPYLPMPFLLAKKLKRMKDCGVDGYFGCWIFGGEVSPMSKLAGKMSRVPQPSLQEVIKEVARDEYGTKSAPAVIKAWRKFSDSWHEYPFSIPFLYHGPINYATAYPLSLNITKQPPTGSWRPLPRDKRGHLLLGDNLEAWLTPFDSRTVVGAFNRILREWKDGISLLREALVSDKENENLKKELNLAKHMMLSMRSTVNIVRFYGVFRKYKEVKGREEKKKLLQGIKKIFKDELEIAQADRELVQFDNRLGYHPEAHEHLFTIKDLDHKISLLKSTLRR